MENLSRREIQQKRSSTYRNIVRLLWVLTVLGIVGVAVLFYMLSKSNLPSFEELENPKYDQASQVFAADNTVFGRYYVENRVPITYDELSPNLVKALLATEDERFHEHSGIDGEALGRVLTKTFLLQNRSAGGASTITQQLAKLLFTGTPASGFERAVQKLKEWIIAVRLERKYTKEEIIAMYLNKFNFINGAYGIRAASEIYFGTTPDKLKQEEAALLVGMLKNPSLYNPLRRPEKTMKRREVVLKQMVKNDLITQTEYDSLRVLDLDMTRFERKTHTDGLAPYFRMVLGEELKKILRSEAEKRSDGKPYDIYRDGLKIFTTIDPIIQGHLEASVGKHMKKLQTKFWKHWKNEDAWTYREPPTEFDINGLPLDGTTEEEIIIRNKVLKNLKFGSDRAKYYRSKLLQPTINDIKSDIDNFELRNVDIERMLAEEKSDGTITKLVKDKMIGSKLAAKYRTVMKGEKWTALQDAWENYNATVEKAFKKPVKMRVFTYENEAMEKDTVLSPIDSIKYHRSFLQVGSLAVDPVTGYIKAWVGGINHKYFQFDHVTSDRQVGSTFKPFIYSTAISQVNISPCFEVDDIPYTIHQGEGNFTLLKDWTPKNANGEYSGERFTLFKGLQWSKNTVSVYLMKLLGDVSPVLDLAKNLGFASKKIPPQPSICLGSADLSVMDMTGAYTAFANNGLYNKPIFIRSIQDKYGREIYKGIREDLPAIEPNVNYVMVQMLKNVMNQGLPGFYGLKSEMGGKTGTTNDYVDGWFMGLTPDLVVGTWVGGEDRWSRFRTLNLGIGAKMARPVFANFMQSIEKDSTADYNIKARFKIPPGDIGIEIDCELYQQERGGSDDWDDENEGFGDDQFNDEIIQDSTLQNIESGGQTTEDEEDEDFGEEFN